MSKHTPGPWRIVDVPGEASHIVGRDNFTVVRQGYISDMDAANARLIAAAPDLLAACKQLTQEAHDPASLRLGTQELQRFVAAWGAMRDAVRKAEGTS